MIAWIKRRWTTTHPDGRRFWMVLIGSAAVAVLAINSLPGITVAIVFYWAWWLFT